MKTLPLSEVKAQLSKIVDTVTEQDERVTITRNGRPAAMIVSVKDVEGLEATIDIMRDPEFYAEVLRAKKEAESGKTRWIDINDLDENFEFKDKKKVSRSRRGR